ncbi:hypothetical protein BO71DRAFT_165358 [Aspergillus ellipticus CBS 707.79]|uniref:Uncharacterized protein n=1 Tax=Aspergillus ellipticus CBS 707.79 TaxID=1448320 RepID=A0A319CTC9_9EURO|nr:hypothetical protein BO71DRAFT_165358 [Aspergillus ellipticus CBS 707.79]
MGIYQGNLGTSTVVCSLQSAAYTRRRERGPQGRKGTMAAGQAAHARKLSARDSSDAATAEVWLFPFREAMKLGQNRHPRVLEARPASLRTSTVILTCLAYLGSRSPITMIPSSAVIGRTSGYLPQEEQRDQRHGIAGGFGCGYSTDSIAGGQSDTNSNAVLQESPTNLSISVQIILVSMRPALPHVAALRSHPSRKSRVLGAITPSAFIGQTSELRERIGCSALCTMLLLVVVNAEMDTIVPTHHKNGGARTRTHLSTLQYEETTWLDQPIYVIWAEGLTERREALNSNPTSTSGAR